MLVSLYACRVQAMAAHQAQAANMQMQQMMGMPFQPQMPPLYDNPGSVLVTPGVDFCFSVSVSV